MPFVTSYKITDLAREAQVSPRTVRYYVQRGLLTGPVFHGRDTAYGHGHLLRLLVIKKLQQSHMPLDEIQARITGASDAALERMLAAEDAAPAESKAPSPRGGPYRSPAPSEPPPQQSVSVGTERWDRIELMPGLELHVRSDAGPEARRAAREIKSQYGQGSLRSS
jgi:DNA-binding transcriptional MerR regulator